jgi:hypothetical protein|nr:MAG TPA: DNA polymerase I [Caudoviricetes sp.]
MVAQDVRRRGLLGTYIIGAVPSYDILDSICKQYKEIFFFVDFNNIIKGIYYPEMLSLILNEIQYNNGTYPSILINEWIQLQTYFEIYNQSRSSKYKIHTVYFSEGGQSYYHLNLHKNYKKRRKNALFALPSSVSNNYKSYDDINEVIRGFLLSSWRWIEILSSYSNILSIRLENLDADFIPELLLRQFDIYNDDACYIILSSDGDMVQTLDIADNIYIFDGNGIISDSNWLTSKKYLTDGIGDDVLVESIGNKDSDNYLTPDRIILYKALVGDTSDNIPGIKGVGNKAFFKNFVNLVPDDVRADDIDAIKKIAVDNSYNNKVADKIAHNMDTFSTMIRLVSFKHLICWLQQNVQRYQKIKDIITSNIGALREPCNLTALKNNGANTLGIFNQNSQFTIEN